MLPYPGQPTNQRQRPSASKKPGLQEVLQLLAQFGPNAQTEQQVGQERLRSLAGNRSFAEQQGAPTLDVLQYQNQSKKMDEDTARRNAQEDRLTNNEENQTQLHTDANMIDMAQLLERIQMGQMPNQPPSALQQMLVKRLGLDKQTTQTPNQPDPRLLKHK